MVAMATALLVGSAKLWCRAYYKGLHHSRQGASAFASVTDVYLSAGYYEEATFSGDDLLQQHCASMDDRTPSALLLVKSHASNFEQRRRIRNTYQAVLQNSAGWSAQVAFVVGQDGHSAAVSTEAAAFGDLIVLSQPEHYQNITFKTMAALQWALTFCPRVHLLASVDDDTVLFPEALLDYFTQHLLPKTRSRHNFVACEVEETPVIMRQRLNLCLPCAKWCVADDEFAGKTHYPLFCHGYFYVWPLYLARNVFGAARTYPAHRFDDVFLTGLVLHSLPGVEQLQISARLGRGAGAVDYAVAVGRAADSPSHFDALWHDRPAQRSFGPYYP